VSLPEQALQVSINLPALEFKLSLNIQRISHFVAAGLASSPSTLTEPFKAKAAS
jgi:hypothetical protein